MHQQEILFEAQEYQSLRLRMREGREIVVPGSIPPPVLIREAEAGVPTGRWIVLEATPDGRHWAWPPAASNDSPNAAAARMK